MHAQLQWFVIFYATLLDKSPTRSPDKPSKVLSLLPSVSISLVVEEDFECYLPNSGLSEHVVSSIPHSPSPFRIVISNTKCRAHISAPSLRLYRVSPYLSETNDDAVWCVNASKSDAKACPH
jgi:hypothetical protein